MGEHGQTKDIILNPRQQQRLQHTLKRVSKACSLLREELDLLHDDIFVTDNSVAEAGKEGVENDD